MLDECYCLCVHGTKTKKKKRKMNPYLKRITKNTNDICNSKLKTPRLNSIFRFFSNLNPFLKNYKIKFYNRIVRLPICNLQ